MMTGMVFWLPSHGNSRVVDRKLMVSVDPWAMALPAACSTCTLMFSEVSVSDGSNGEHVTVTGSVIATLPVRLGVPGLMVIASAADAVAQATATAAAGTSLPSVIFGWNIVGLLC
jgi:hypothetical protein